jgi:acyl carrier protein
VTDDSSLQHQIGRLLVERLHIEVDSFDTDLIDSGLLDSMGLVELMVGLEERFGSKIAFDEIEIDNFRTIEAIAGLLRSKL